VYGAVLPMDGLSFPMDRPFLPMQGRSVPMDGRIFRVHHGVFPMDHAGYSMDGDGRFVLHEAWHVDRKFLAMCSPNRPRHGRTFRIRTSFFRVHGFFRAVRNPVRRVRISSLPARRRFQRVRSRARNVLHTRVSAGTARFFHDAFPRLARVRFADAPTRVLLGPFPREVSQAGVPLERLRLARTRTPARVPHRPRPRRPAPAVGTRLVVLSRKKQIRSSIRARTSMRPSPIQRSTCREQQQQQQQ
jgi:hypothetical protein